MEQPMPVRERVVEWSVASRALVGESACGDVHVVEPHALGVLLAVIDGLGHGEEAASAAEVAAGVLRAQADRPVTELLQRCHAALAGTRGAAATLASIHAPSGIMAWAGVGDVEGILFRADAASGRPSEYVSQRGGVLGFRLPLVRPGSVPIRRGDVLILATDGISRAFADDPIPFASPAAAAARILERYAVAADDALVLVARMVGVGS
jgi:serine phosphatase RsbU (regulator of sigma subunit)